MQKTKVGTRAAFWWEGGAKGGCFAAGPKAGGGGGNVLVGVKFFFCNVCIMPGKLCKRILVMLIVFRARCCALKCYFQCGKGDYLPAFSRANVWFAIVE